MSEHYSAKVLDHVHNPRNVGSIEDANVVVQAGDPGCGDALVFFIKIENDVIRDIKFLIKGCGAAIATSSMATELVMGRHLDEVIARAKLAEVNYFVVPGTNVESSKRAVEIAEKYENIYAAVGIHPHHI